MRPATTIQRLSTAQGCQNLRHPTSPPRRRHNIEVQGESFPAVGGLAVREHWSNRQIEDAAIELVLARERAAGRHADDTRGRGALADIEGDRLIEVKAFGGSARGVDLWLEGNQVAAALAEPERFHLVLVEHVRGPEPRIIDLHGAELAALLERRREKRHFEVPLPTGVYDRLCAESEPSE